MEDCKLVSFRSVLVGLFLALLSSGVFAAAPVISKVQITRLSDRRSSGLVFYGQTVEVTASDADGWANLSSVTIVFSDLSTYVVRPADTGIWTQVDAHAVQASYYPEGGIPASLQECPLPRSIIVSDASGHTDSVSLDPGDVASETVLQGMMPADTSVVTQLRPTFSWSLGGIVPDRQSLTLWESGDEPSGSRSPLWSVPSVSGLSIAFDADGTAVHHDLLAGRQYLWVLTAQRDDLGLPGLDPRVHVLESMQAQQRFALAEDRPVMPELEGRLIYTINPGNETATRSSQTYVTDASHPSWFGPVGAVYADFSPDGEKVIYSEEPQRYLWVDARDGSAPTCLGITGFDARWSPDGTQICFSRYRTDTAMFNIYVANADGTNEQMLYSEPNNYQRFCAWSPDGEWISYRRSPDDIGRWLWLIRPDGTENHPVVCTGIQGYPGYSLGYAPEQAWAPDGRRLVTVFDASSSSGGYIKGLGVISREGGLLKPILLTPPEVQCCADAHLPSWSPDGTQILFSAALQVPPDPNWATQGVVSEVELWVLNADGSGDPIRLTNDRIFEGYVSWWGPNVFPDVPKGNWAYCAISTCHKSGIVAGLGDGSYGPTRPVSRDQMAVYISRALAEGDWNVPEGPPSPSFNDVPTDFWAYKYIEYAKNEQVVQGYSDGSYQPTWDLDRAQMAVFLARALNGSDALVPSGPATASFPDVPTDFWAYRHVEDLKARAITGGYEDANYHPEYICTRDQMAMFVARAFTLPM